MTTKLAPTSAGGFLGTRLGLRQDEDDRRADQHAGQAAQSADDDQDELVIDTIG
jgi:hypothetical protein